jgi:hypothetical protein
MMHSDKSFCKRGDGWTAANRSGRLGV